MSDTRWFYVESERPRGPVTLDVLVAKLMDAVLPPRALVWRHGLSEWTEAARLPEVANQMPPPIPRPDAPAPEAPPPATESAPATEPTPPPEAHPPAPPPPVPAVVASTPRSGPAAIGTWPTWSLADNDFPAVVHDLHQRRWSGVLIVNHMAMEKLVTVRDGRLVFASSSNHDDRLGELLMRSGKITLNQYLEAGLAIRKGKRLGAVLVEEAIIDANDLIKVVIEHTQEIIYGLFQWTEGTYQLRDDLQNPEAITLKLSTPNIILEGIRRIDSWSRIVFAIGSIDARYVRAPHYEDEVREMTLSQGQAFLLRDLRETRAVEEVCEMSQLSPFDVCRTLWAFRVMGVIQKVDEPG